MIIALLKKFDVPPLNTSDGSKFHSRQKQQVEIDEFCRDTRATEALVLRAVTK